MILVKPSFQIIDVGNVDEGVNMLKRIELAGRTCYKSEVKVTSNSAKAFVEMILKNTHESVIEHEKVSVRVICDRGVTHEIVRHRIASYSQESTRYCDYKGGVTFIIPVWMKVQEGEYKNLIDPSMFKGPEDVWFNHLLWSEKSYIKMRKEGWTKQQARSILPNSLKTEIVMTMNLREWRHFFKLRTSSKAHPQMTEIARPMLDEFKRLIPVVFDDLTYEE